MADRTQNQIADGTPRAICPACSKPATHGFATYSSCCDESRIAAYSCGEHLWIMQWRADQ